MKSSLALTFQELASIVISHKSLIYGIEKRCTVFLLLQLRKQMGYYFVHDTSLCQVQVQQRRERIEAAIETIESQLFDRDKTNIRLNLRKISRPDPNSKFNDIISPNKIFGQYSQRPLTLWFVLSNVLQFVHCCAFNPETLTLSLALIYQLLGIGRINRMILALLQLINTFNLFSLKAQNSRWCMITLFNRKQLRHDILIILNQYKRKVIYFLFASLSFPFYYLLQAFLVLHFCTGNSSALRPIEVISVAYHCVSMLLLSISTELLRFFFLVPFIFNINILVRINHTAYATGANKTLIVFFRLFSWLYHYSMSS